jgi:hypothetical protein
MAFSTYNKVTLTTKGKSFWRTKKKAMTFVVDAEARPIELSGAYWDEGSRSEWFTVSKTGVWTPLPSIGPAPYDCRKVPSIAPTADMAVVEAGTFLGKPATVYAHVISQDGWVF